MLTNPQFQKITSVLLTFIMLTELSGCVSVRENIQIYNVPMKDNNPACNAYFIAGRKSGGFSKYKNHIVKNLSIEDGFLTAEPDKGYNKAWNYFNIYVRSDSLIEIAPDKTIRVALADIYEVKLERINWFAFLGYSVVSLAALTALMIMIYGEPDNSK